MKKTEPPRQSKFAKLSPDLARFVESMGMYFENMGIPRIGGRILGILMIAHEPLSAEEVAGILKVSRGSISTNIRALLSSGMVEKKSVLHDRATYFVFSEAALEQRMATGIQSAVIFKKLAEQGLAALPENDSARVRMQRSVEWSDVLVDTFQTAIKEWRARYPY